MLSLKIEKAVRTIKALRLLSLDETTQRKAERRAINGFTLNELTETALALAEDIQEVASE